MKKYKYKQKNKKLFKKNKLKTYSKKFCNKKTKSKKKFNLSFKKRECDKYNRLFTNSQFADGKYYMQLADGRKYEISKEDYDMLSKKVDEYYENKGYNRLKDVVRRYTAHMQIKFSLPDSEFKEHYENNMKLALHDDKFRNYLLDDY